MARRRKKDPVDHIAEITPTIIFGAVLLWLCIPGIQPSLGAVALLAASIAIAAIIGALGVLLWRKHPLPTLAAGPAHPPIIFPPAPPNLSLRSKRPQLPWTLELLRSLEWKVYEDVVAEFAKHLGLVGKTTRIGADGGIDVHIYEPGNPRPVMVIQCKAWESYRVGVKSIRELYGVMAADEIKEGAFFTTGDFTAEARDFAVGKALDLVNGAEFLTRIGQLPIAAQAELLEFATTGNYTTPSCPSCGEKMITRTATKGPNAGNSFWGCRHYPRCKRTFQAKGSSEK